MSSRVNCLFSVWNKSRGDWATTTNYSTQREAHALRKVIEAVCSDKYEVRERAFGTIKE